MSMIRVQSKFVTVKSQLTDDEGQKMSQMNVKPETESTANTKKGNTKSKGKPTKRKRVCIAFHN